MKDEFDEKRSISFWQMLLMAGIVVLVLLISAWLLIWTGERTSNKHQQVVSGEQEGADSESSTRLESSEYVQENTVNDIGQDAGGNHLQEEPGSVDTSEDSSQQEEKTDTGSWEGSGEAERIPDVDSIDMGKETEVFVPEKVEDNTDLGMLFEEVSETVTAKDATNLRDIPKQGADSNILCTLYNGETVERIGVSDTGWSKLDADGQICYAVSSLLTTDLTYRPVEEEIEVDDGIETEFAECNEKVSPKIRVNLRALPSVTHPQATVAATLQYGEIVTRTGINTDVGWSRVEYNGQTLYCVSSYIYVVEE